MNEKLHVARTQVTEVQNELHSTQTHMNEELHASRTQVIEMQNENIQLRQWQQQMMAWYEQMNRQIMALQQLGLSSQLEPSTQLGPRDQFYNEEQNYDCNDDDFN